ncbi:MAG: segregation/condensation protein A [Ardenticatenaceae bacterium]|nr:segregation/condensation protein A [Ardenticatenaceae bacterium]
MKYTIDLPAFNGPLDLLLHLIDRQELDITAISLVRVTEQYLAQVRQMQEEQMAHLIDFLVIGARLAQIKSRALLPQTPGLLMDDEEEEDPAEALVRQLQQYKRFKQMAAWLLAREEAGLRTYLRLAPPPKLEKRLDLSGVTLAGLLTAVQETLARAETMEESVAIVKPRRVTIEQQIGRLRQRLQEQAAFQFTDILSAKRDRVEIAITLLAVLELIKRQELSAHQPELFGPIELRSTA